MTGPTCHLCDVELFDDPHWNSQLEALTCEAHCDNEQCSMFSVGGGTGDSRPSARMPDGDHATTAQGLSLLPGGVALAADGPFPAWMIEDAYWAATFVRRERLAWLFTSALWVLVILVGIEAGR